MSVSVSVSACSSVRLSVSLSVYPSVRLSVRLSVRPSAYLLNVSTSLERSVILTNDTLDLKDVLWPRVDTNLSLSVFIITFSSDRNT